MSTLSDRVMRALDEVIDAEVKKHANQVLAAGAFTVCGLSVEQVRALHRYFFESVGIDPVKLTPEEILSQVKTDD